MVKYKYGHRKSSAERGYGSRWQKYRDAFLKRNPLCVMHQKLGQVVQATVVDHIIPHRGDQSLFWDKSNHQALCESCHNRHKQRQEHTGKEVGCDTSGIPLDAHHHWKTGEGG